MSQIGGAEMSEACRDFEQMAFHEKDRTMETITVRRSDSIATLAGALSKAQGSMSAASKDRKNPHFNSSYATLASVWDACREPLATNGLAVVQLPGMLDDHLTVETHLLHESGEFIVSTLVMPVDKMTAQGVGSSITYARRYALSAMVGVAPDDDDDGNAASGNNATPSARNAVKKPASKPLTGGHAPPAVVGKEPKPVDPPETKAQESAFQAAIGKIAMTFTHPELDKLTQRLVDSVKLDEKEKTALLGMIKGQRLKADEAEKQANANTAA